MSKTNWFKSELNKIKAHGLLINLKTIESPMDARIKVDGKWVLNFCSNNYLGLANDKRVKIAAKKAIDRFGVGPGAVRTIAGTTKLHSELEERISKFKKAESVISYQSGFIANLAVIPALVGEGDLIFSDELNHASIIDACRLSKAQVIRYNHLNTKDLEQKITSTLKVRPRTSASKDRLRMQRVLIVTDGVFSMDGDIAPLPEIIQVANKFDALVMVDDAHGEGVLGKNGRGIVDHFNLHGKVDIEIGTLSKAFGVVGGFAAGKKELIDWLRQRSRPFLFSSAMTIPDTGAAIESVKILEKSDKLVRKLWDNADYFKNEIKKIGFNTGNSQTPITPVIVGDAKLAQNFSKKLFEKGIFVVAIGFPTVPLGQARLRVMISASHQRADLDKAIEAFLKVGKKLKVI